MHHTAGREKSALSSVLFIVIAGNVLVVVMDLQVTVTT